MVGLLVWLEFGAGDFLPFDFVEGLDAVFLAEDVEGAVAADGEEPGFEAVADFGDVLLAEADEGVLDDVAGAVEVVEDGGGVAEKGRFEFDHGLFDELFPGVWHGVGRGVGAAVRGRNGRGSRIFGEISGIHSDGRVPGFSGWGSVRWDLGVGQGRGWGWNASVGVRGELG